MILTLRLVHHEDFEEEQTTRSYDFSVSNFFFFLICVCLKNIFPEILR